MQIFLSYASEDRQAAEQIQLALVGAQFGVFFDKESLPPGGDYHDRIRKAVQRSDLFVFLISSSSVVNGSYALTELGYAREKWPHPKAKVIPVNLSGVPLKSVPSYLTAVTILEPEGNAAAEILSAVVIVRKTNLFTRTYYVVVTLLALAILGGSAWWLIGFESAKVQKPVSTGRPPSQSAIERNVRETITLDQYKLLLDLQERVDRVMTDLNRRRAGIHVKGLIVNNDIVPLTDFFTRLNSNKSLLTEQFHKILWEEGQLAIKFANAQNEEIASTIEMEYVVLQEKFHARMNEVFSHDKNSQPEK